MPHDPVSAQVILHTANRSAEIPTTANIAQLAPPPAIAASLADWFNQHGFDVLPLVGISFSITAPRQTFIDELGTDPATAGPNGELAFIRDAINDLASQIQAITVSTPPAFGPGNP